MAKRPGKREEAIDKGKLALACLKERWAYKEFFKEKSEALTVALKRYRDGWNLWNERGSTEPNLKAMSEDSRVFGDFHRECMERFGIANLPLSEIKLSVDDVLLLLDPDKKVEDIPKRIEFILADMFSPKRIYPVDKEGVPHSVLMHEGAGIAYITSKPIEPFQRLLLIDMRGSYASLKKEFAEYLERVKRTRELPCPQDDFREDLHTYDSWMPDNSRKRKEAWEYLKIWRMRRHRKSFGEIARTLSTPSKKMTIDAAKKNFYRAYELIEGRNYQPESFRQSYREIKKEELRRICATCPDNSDKGGTCDTPCPDALLYADQDKKSSPGKLRSDHLSLDESPAKSLRPDGYDPDGRGPTGHDLDD